MNYTIPCKWYVYIGGFMDYFGIGPTFSSVSLDKARFFWSAEAF